MELISLAFEWINYHLYLCWFLPPSQLFIAKSEIYRGKGSFLQRLNPFKSIGKQGHSGNANLIVKPLRIIQFLVVLLIFVFVIYAIAIGNPEVSAVTCLLLIALSGVYVFVLSVELISYFGGGELYAIPIFILSFLGVILFGIAGILLILLFTTIKLWYMLVILCLCLLAFILFLIDIIIMLLYWKQKCFCKHCMYPGQTEVHFDDNKYCHPQCETTKIDLMTSVSDVRVECCGDEETPQHGLRKIGQARRRQYVDRPSSARSTSVIDFAKCQTDSPVMTHIQSQTQRHVVEMPTQTVSKCELCQRKMGMFATPGDMQPTMQLQAPCAPCAPCPALVQLIRGMPCCPGCRCVTTGIVQMPQQSQQQQMQRQDQEQLSSVSETQRIQPEQISSTMLTSEQEERQKAGVPASITKLTLASYCVTPSRKSEISSQTMNEDTKYIKKMSEEVGEKRQRTRSSLKEKTRGSSLMKPEVHAYASDPEKGKISIVKCPRKAITTSPSKSVKSNVDEKPVTSKTDSAYADLSQSKSTIIEQLSEIVVDAPDPSLVSPPQKLAHMINLLQELEEGKPESAVENSATTLDKEEKRVVVEEQIPEKDIQAQKEIIEDNVQKVEEVKQEVVETIEEKAQEPKPSLKAAVPTRDTVDKSVDSEITVSEISPGEDSGSSDQLENDGTKAGVSSLRTSGALKKDVSVESTSTQKPNAETQATDTDSSTGKAKGSFLKKKNKVEPCAQVNADTDTPIWAPECHSEPNTPAMCKGETEKFLADKQGVLGEMPVCPSCKKIQYFAVSPSYYYYSVYRDKRGRLFCDFCASKNSIKVLYKHDPSEQKFLKCARCGTLLRQKTTRSEYFRNKNDNCAECIQMHGRVRSISRK